MNILSSQKNQQGAALIVSLVILVAMTLLGITSMKGTSTELAMAGNLRESGLAFQAAEAGLRSGELIVENSNSNAMFRDGTNSAYLDDSTADPDYLDPNSWAQAETSNVSLAGVYANPSYFIKFMGEWSQNRPALVNTGSGYGGAPPGISTSNYRVTSRGMGQTGNTYRTVQSYYGVRYN